MFCALPVFWALYDQHATRWVFQAEKLNREIIFGYVLLPSQIQALGPLLILSLLPIFNYGIYPAMKKCGLEMHPLFHKMVFGINVRWY